MLKTTNETKNFFASHKRALRLFLALGLPLIIFFKLAWEVVEKEHMKIDAPVLYFIHEHASTMLDSVAVFISNSGYEFGTLIAVILLACYVIFKQKKYQNLAFIAIGIGGAMVANVILKLLFMRPRPELWHWIVAESGYSFPSGHAMLSAAIAAVAIYLFWGTRHRWWIAIVAILCTTLIGLSRLYLGVHYPSDIIAGWSVSVAWVTLVDIALKYYDRNIIKSYAKHTTKPKTVALK